MDEPTAAAVAYGLHRTSGVRNVLVYDIGGGTLDTSLLYLNGKTVSVLGVAGDDHLGGSDFDNAMLGLIESKLSNATVGEPMATPEMVSCRRASLRVLAESAKIDLSSRTVVNLACAGDDGLARTFVVSRAEFETASRQLFERAVTPVKKVLADQVMTP